MDDKGERESKGDPESTGSLSVVDRLVVLLDAESALIEAGETDGLAATTVAKSRMLLEIYRLMTGQAGAGQLHPTQSHLKKLKASLARNERALSAQLSAARAVSDILMNALREQQSDTTYGSRPSAKIDGVGYGRVFG